MVGNSCGGVAVNMDACPAEETKAKYWLEKTNRTLLKEAHKRRTSLPNKTNLYFNLSVIDG